jgi:hypothetical protein
MPPPPFKGDLITGFHIPTPFYGGAVSVFFVQVSPFAPLVDDCNEAVINMELGLLEKACQYGGSKPQGRRASNR